MNPEQALEIVSETDVGMVRSHNEDAVATDATMGLTADSICHTCISKADFLHCLSNQTR